MRKLFLALSFSVFAFPAHAESRTPYQAIIISVHDGDTALALHDGHREKLRLASCDSPERATPEWPDQPASWEATAALIRLIMGQTVTVVPTGQESYHRTVAAIHVGQVDVCEEMLREGEAMIDPRYSSDPALYEVQRQAIIARRGIWAGQPVFPWVWRRMAH